MESDTTTNTENKMKLSEAILLGSLQKPQGFDGTGHPHLPEVCAFGAALLATGAHKAESVVAYWPWLVGTRFTCPACQANRDDHSYGVIPHLNNTHKWTRERIAAWVATVEPQEQPTSESVVTSDNLNSEVSRKEVLL